MYCDNKIYERNYTNPKKYAKINVSCLHNSYCFNPKQSVAEDCYKQKKF